MASDTDKQIKQMFDKLKKIKQKMTSKQSMQETGDFAADLIKKRTRAGFGVESHGSRKSKLDKLSPDYIEQRKRKKPSGPTTPAKSNLTNSGKMLDDLEAKVDSNKVSIGPSSQKSKDKAKYVSEKRPFNHLSSAEIKQIEQELDKKAKELSKK